MNKLPFKMIALSTGIVSNGTFAYLMWKATIEGYTVVMNQATAPYGEQWIEIPLAILGLIILVLMLLYEVWNYD